MIIDIRTGENTKYYFRKLTREEIIWNQYDEDNGWSFSWKKAIDEGSDVFALITEKYPEEPQGLVALKEVWDSTGYGHIKVNILAASPANVKFFLNEGRLIPNEDRRYRGVGKCLLAFACSYALSIKNIDGFVELKAKDTNISFYEKLGGFNFGFNKITFSDNASQKLASDYFPGGIKWK